MKSLTSKKLYIYLAYSKLKGTAPREFTDINEMVTTVDEILPALEKGCPEFMEFRKEAEIINNDVATGKVQQEEGMGKIAELQKRVREYELVGGMEPTTVEMENGAFAILFQQFDRWAKGDPAKQMAGWFDKLDDFVSFRKDMTVANN